jgi:hypothetical protein
MRLLLDALSLFVTSVLPCQLGDWTAIRRDCNHSA